MQPGGGRVQPQAADAPAATPACAAHVLPRALAWDHPLPSAALLAAHVVCRGPITFFSHVPHCRRAPARGAGRSYLHICVHRAGGPPV